MIFIILTLKGMPKVNFQEYIYEINYELIFLVDKILTSS